MEKTLKTGISKLKRDENGIKTKEVIGIIPACHKVSIEFSGNTMKVTGTNSMSPDKETITINVNASRYNYYFGLGQKAPTMKTLEKWISDGIAKTVTGCRVEPDGIGPDGSPSWLLVLGYC